MNLKPNNLLIAALLIGLHLPYIAIAHPGHPEGDELLQSYCTRILVFEVQHNKKIADIETAYTAKEKTRLKEIENIRSRQDKAIVSLVDDFDKEIASYIEDLKNNAKSEAVLAELAKLNDQLYTLTRERNVKVQQIMQDYRAGINDLVVARKGSFMTAESAFKNESKRILAKSKADCKEQRDVKLIFADTTNGLKVAHELLKGKIAGLVTPTASLNKLSTARDVAWDAMMTDYKTKVQAAIDNFKTALPQ